VDAEHLGDHYMTAYRYVRLGLLHAHKRGSTWQVDQADLDDFRAIGPPSADERGGVSAAAAGRGRAARGRPAPWSERLEARLTAGDGSGAWAVIEAALASGAEPDMLYLDVIAPALRRIGDAWAAGELDIATEHLASGIAMRLIGRLGSRFVRRGRSRGVVLIGAPSGEHHSLPIALLADLLRGGGWEVSDLGCDLPVDAFVGALERAGRLVAVGVSVTDPACLPAARDTIAALRQQSPHIVVLAGGGALGDAAAALALGADAWAPDGRQALAVLESLVAPRQGRVVR
jgi:methanogenic corrinoid protein MtbC1